MATRTVSVRLVSEIGGYVSGVNKAAAATMRLGETATASTKKAQGGFDLAGKGGLLMGAAVAGGMAVAIRRSADFEKSMSAVGAATQATGSTLHGLRDAAMKAGADTKYSATEAAQGITEMAKAGVSAKDIMGGGLTGALSLAAAGQIEVADAAGIASTAMTQFGLTGKEIPHVADLLAAGAGKAMGSVDDLGMALNQAGLVAASSGLSIEETTGTLAAFASAGLVGSDAGTSLKSSLLMLQGPSSKAAEVMSDLGINMYDANGNMLSMAGMAGQLQTHLGGLTQEQRNSALATIFGSDAVRAANVLYSEGAAGIQEWTRKVNDAGYASKQASALQDNLAGDLEKLGGAIDNLWITVGGSAQGPLRDLTQDLTSVVGVASTVVDAFQAIPGPVLAGAAALTAVAVLKGPVGSALETIALKSLYMRDSMAGASLSMGGLKAAGSGLLGVFGGPWGIALAGATVGLTALVSWLGQSDEATDAAKSATEGYAAALEGANGALDGNVRAAAAKAAQDAGLLDAAETAGISLRTVTDAITNQGGAYDGVRAKLAAYIATQNQPMQTENGPIYQMSEQGKKAQEAMAALDLLAKQVPKNAAADAQLASATQGATSSTDEFTAAAAAAKTEMDDAKQAVDSFKLSLDILSGANVSMIQVESDLQSAIANSTGALKGLNGTVVDGTGKLNLQSESGRKAADVLLGIRDSGNQLISTMMQQGATTDQVRAKDAELRASFIASAQQMGISKDAAGKLADQILGIPASRKTTITADTSQAEAAVSKFMQQHRVITIGTRTVTARVGTTYQDAGSGYAHGGYTGDGGKYEPKGVVHGGEFVFTKEQTAKAGVGALSALAGSLEGYARGGWVGGSSMGSIRVPAVADTSGLSAGLNAAASAAASAMEPNYSGSATASSSALVNFGHLLQRMGARVSEHPAFGGVTMGAHVRGSKHYIGKAIDVNTRPGTSALEQRELAPMQRMAAAAGFQTIFMAPGHYNHLHVASYKTGTPYVPKDGYAYLHQGERVVPREQNLRSREFSGGGRGGGAVVVNVAAPAVSVTLDGREVRHVARVEAQAVVSARESQQAINARSWQ